MVEKFYSAYLAAVSTEISSNRAVAFCLLFTSFQKAAPDGFFSLPFLSVFKEKEADFSINGCKYAVILIK